jgi:hypothetical protein
MLTVETIGRIRRALLVDEKPIRQIVRELRVSRKTVRKAVRAAGTEFRYERQVQLQPRLGAFVARLDAMLEANTKRPRRERLTARRLLEQLQVEGCAGAAAGPPAPQAATEGTACSVMCSRGAVPGRGAARCSCRSGSRRARPTGSTGATRRWCWAA